MHRGGAVILVVAGFVLSTHILLNRPAPPAATHETLDDLFRAFHERSCSFETPILVVRMFQGGFGNLVNWWIMDWYASLHRFARNEIRRVMVFDRTPQSVWKSLTPADFLHESACQTLFDVSPKSFTDITQTDPRANEFALKRLPGFDVPLRVTLRKVIRYMFRPRVSFRELKSLGVLGSAPDSDRFDFRNFVSPHKYAAAHVRLGDACTTRETNRGRPPCQPIEDYLKFLRIQSVFVASDAEVNGWSLKINRTKYTPVANKKIEEFLAPHEERAALVDFVGEIVMLSHAHTLVGQCYSSMFNLALFLSTAKYACVDRGYPCIRGGCPSRMTPFEGCNWMRDAYVGGGGYEPLYAAIYNDSRTNSDLCTSLDRIGAPETCFVSHTLCI